MNIELDQLAVARSIAEEWFASLSDEVMDHISANREQDQVTEGYNKVVELYVGVLYLVCMILNLQTHF